MSIDPDKIDDDLRRARDAERFLEEPLFVEAKAAVRKEIFRKFEFDKDIGPEGRERVWLMLQMLTKIEEAIATHVRTGRLASDQLDTLERRKKFLGVI